MLIELAETINERFDIDTIVKFRHEFRVVRSFMTFMRLQRNDKHIKMPENCKYLYHLAGKIKELAGDKIGDPSVVISPDATDVFGKSQKEWKKNYSTGVFTKLATKIAALDFSKLHPDLLDNFFSNVDREDSLEG